MISFNHNSSPSLVCSGNRIAHNVAANCRLRPSGLLLLIVLILSSQSAFAQVHFASVLKDVEENKYGKDRPLPTTSKCHCSLRSEGLSEDIALAEAEPEEC